MISQYLSPMIYLQRCVRCCRFLPILLLLLTGGANLHAQLDTIHWIPPMYARAGMGPQFICLTTPEEQPFEVTIRDGAGKKVTAFTISSGQPVQYLLSDTYSQLLIPAYKAGIANTGAGLVINGPKKFYTWFRAHSEGGTDACQLTCKGRAALGTTFRIANMRQVTDKTGGRSNFIGILATEDATIIRLSGFDPLTEFTGAVNVSADGSVQVSLQKGESVVFAHNVGEIGDDLARNGFLGALLTATKPVAVNTGSWLGAPVIYQSNDIGADQIVPLERVGKEYILCRGGGPTSLEHPIIVAHTDNTFVWINGDLVPVDTLAGGEYFIVPTFYFTPDENMYIRSSAPVFVYQMTGGVRTGKYSLHSGAFMYVPPINCGIADKVDYVFQPHKLGDLKFDAGLTIVALRDSVVTVLMDGNPVPMGAPADVSGNPDFVTYSNLELFNHTKATANKELSIEAGGVVQVALIEQYQFVGFSAFFSSYQERPPEIQVDLMGDGICPDTLTAQGFFDGIQWMYEDSVLQTGPDTFFIVTAPGPYKAVGYIGACFSTATVVDSLLVPLSAPQFPYSIQEPSCFGASNGFIEFGTPNGGTPPYRFSIDNGYIFSASTFFDQVAAGNYKLIVQDVSGCNNQPIQLKMGQPDSFYVNIAIRRMPDPFKSGDLAELEAFPSHPVISVAWSPVDSMGCADCFEYDFRPEATTWVHVTVYDSIGCQATDSLLLLVDPRIYVPNIIDPESVKGNDRFTLFSEDPLPVYGLSVFDRWGGQVFDKKNFFTNNPDDGWDGRLFDEKVVPGVYTFVARVELEPGRVVVLRGDITVL